MPISALDGCPAEHWSDVKTIITEAVETIADPKFVINLVSDADDIGVIQKRIVQNIYNSDVIVCDVSGKNPNVMFELGMRLAFDKPTIIVKDEDTDYAFDTGIIEHMTYPRDLRFNRIVAFKAALAAKVVGTWKASVNDPEHSTFLKNFGTFHVAKLDETVTSPDAVILEKISEIQDEVARIRRRRPTDERTGTEEINHNSEGFIILTNAVLECQRRGVPAPELEDKVLHQKGISWGKYFPRYLQFKNALDLVTERLRYGEGSGPDSGRDA